MDTDDNLKDFGSSNSTAMQVFMADLKLSLAGLRYYTNASLFEWGSGGHYWSSSPRGSSRPYSARSLDFDSSDAVTDFSDRSVGDSIRCFKNEYSPC